MICSWTHSHERSRAILTAGGITTLRPIHLGEIVNVITAGDAPPQAIIASVQEGGLPLVAALRALSDAEQKNQQIPVLLFDHEGNIDAARAALRLNVADYLHMSLPDDVLISRVQKLVQNAQQNEDSVAVPEEPDQPVSSGQMQWDASIAAIFSGGTWLQLSPVEWRLFEALLQRRGETVPSIDLITGPLGRTEENATTASLLRLHLSRLRAKVEEHGVTGLNIVTVRSRGYMLI